MMNFVPYPLAKKLKEKGFKERCLAHYYSGEFDYNVCNFRGVSLPNLLMSYNALTETKDLHPNYYSYVDAPTVSQVMEWLRHKNIYVEVVVDDESDAPLTYNIHVGNECVFHHHGEYFFLKDWGLCELVGIEYALDNLI